jgi:hypothetical protein
MADAPPPDGPHAQLGATGELVAAWDGFRRGDAVPCPLDRAHLALTVDAAGGVYRFVCTQCGAASPWFESGPTGLRLRGPSADQLQPED